ncbi:glycosyltransferase family 2 protein [Thermodesulfobacteriota bacterium]
MCSVLIPKISIVTPSYNQGLFLEDTILSVVGQNYPNLEYIIMDGGSEDNSVEIIKKYEKYLAYWVTEKDDGQSYAINKGFQKATGDILGWLNSDDMYLPGTLNHVGKKLDPDSAQLLFGNSIHLKEEGNIYGSEVIKWHQESNIFLFDYVIQPSTFWTKRTWETVGSLDEQLHYTFDWDWFIRAKISGVRFKPENRPLSIFRLHSDIKTFTGGKPRLKEISRIYKTYSSEKYEKLFFRCHKRALKRKLVMTLFNYFKKASFVRIIIKIFYPILSIPYKYYEIRDVLHMR